MKDNLTNGENRPKRKIFRTVLLIFLILILLLAVLVYGYFHSKYSKIYNDSNSKSYSEDYEGTVNASDELTEAMRESTVLAGLSPMESVLADGNIVWDDNVFNVLLIGTDERTDGSYSDNARGDACMLLSVNMSGEAPVVSLVSLERGMGVPILEGPYAGQWDWLTHTFRYGGAELLMQEVSHCFKVDVDYYVRINFNIFIHAINTLGGVTVNFDQAEADAFIKAGYHNITVGENHLDGEKALYYARLRYIDNDWVRIQRQREIVISVIEKCKNKSFDELDSIIDSLLPLVKTNIPESKVAELMKLIPVLPKTTTQQMTVPAQDTFGSMVGMGGRNMFAVDFEKNSETLKEFLYPQLFVQQQPQAEQSPATE
ncbi:MAG: LCP family protein [Oscillospiraceae bacterium]|nr:LCP family protein [Oscillospiraceae bacterium]